MYCKEMLIFKQSEMCLMSLYKKILNFVLYIKEVMLCACVCVTKNLVLPISTSETPGDQTVLSRTSCDYLHEPS